MKHYSAYSITVAMCLAMLAGFVDVIGFLHLGGYFLSFMSGNTTRLAAATVQEHWGDASLVASIIATFVLGAFLGTIVGNLAGHHHMPFAVLSLVTFLLVAAIGVFEQGHAKPSVILMAASMGAVNTVFQRDGDIVIGVTYMTGTLVKIGQRLAQAFFGGGKFAWLPFLALWLGLVGGGVCGVYLFQSAGLHCLWVAALWSAVLTLIVRVHSLHVA